MNKIIIIGGEGTAINIAEAIIDAINNYNYGAEFLGMANDHIDLGQIKGFNIVTTIKKIHEFYKYNDVKIIFSLYKPKEMVERKNLFHSLKIPSGSLINFIHPSSYISKSIKLGEGNVVLSNCTVQNSVAIGSYNIINSNVVIEHDTILGNNNFIAASAVLGSNINMGNCCFIGLNSSIRENVQVADNTFLGMNSLLLNCTSNNEIWYGNPAQRK